MYSSSFITFKLIYSYWYIVFPPAEYLFLHMTWPLLSREMCCHYDYVMTLIFNGLFSASLFLMNNNKNQTPEVTRGILIYRNVEFLLINIVLLFHFSWEGVNGLCMCNGHPLLADLHRKTRTIFVLYSLFFLNGKHII